MNRIHKMHPILWKSISYLKGDKKMKTLFCYGNASINNEVATYHPLFGKVAGLRRLIWIK